MTTPTRELRLPVELCEAAERQFGKHFSNLEELLVFVLQELVREDARTLDRGDQQMIEDRLRDLGYL